MSFDPKCYDLAKEFLADAPPALQTETLTNQLAQTIQDTIEQWIETTTEEWIQAGEGQ